VLSEAEVITRSAQPYVAIRARVTMQAGRQGLGFDVSPGPDGDQWTARLEIYETNPAEEPDMPKWTTQLAFRLSD
jgi:hypothetical protein